MNTIAIIDRDFAWNFIRIRVKKNGAKNSLFLKGNLEWIMVNNGETLEDDVCIMLEREDAVEISKALFQAAIEANILPDLDRVKGELDATKIHLADMQKAFNTLLLSMTK